jgi:hypothetical protein
MKRRHTQPSDGNSALRSARVSEEEIDRLYGLEPVINVGEAADEGMEATHNVAIACPYCGESFDTKVDLTGGSFEYVEDCQVCCQPINLKVEVSEAAELTGVTALQLND